MAKMTNSELLDLAASIAHTVNKVYCESIGDMSQPDWQNAPEWQQDSARAGAKFHLFDDGNFDPSKSHASWLQQKIKDGWTYGEHKDLDKKRHPCIRTYDSLPEEQKVKDLIFCTVLRTIWYLYAHDNLVNSE